LSRTSLAIVVFFTTALAALVGMIVLGQSRVHRIAQAAVISPAATQNQSGVTPARRQAGPNVLAEGPPVEEPPVGMGVPPGYRSTSARNYMRMRLHELTVAEEWQYNETNTYTADLSKLQLQRRTGDVVVLRVTYAGPAGWSAEATNPALPGKSCVTYAGPTNLLPKVPETMTDHTQPLGERDLVCDKP
jgi:hypothetical protein